MSSEVLDGEVVTAKQVEVVTVDLDISTNWKLGRSDHFSILVDVLVLLSSKEWSLNDAGVLLSRLKDGDGVVSKVEGDDETAVDILRHLGVESSGVSQDFLIVVDILKEVNLWLLRNQIIDITERVDLRSESIVRRNLLLDGVTSLGLLGFTDGELSVEFGHVVVVGEFVNSKDVEDSSVSDKGSIAVDLIASQVSVSDEALARLVDGEGLGELLSAEVDSEGISSIVSEVALTDLAGVVSKEVVPDVGDAVTRSHEKSENLTIVVEELLLGSNTSTTESLLEELKEVLVLLGRDRNLALLEGVAWGLTGRSLGLSTVLLK